MSPRTAYFHEDDFCQIEVLPAQNWQDCLNRFGQLTEFSERHRTLDGQGWTDIHMRSAAAIPLVELHLERAGLARLLVRTLPEFEEVRTGYGDYSEPCANALAFGTAGQGVIYCSGDAAGFIEYLWLDLGNASPQGIHEALYAALLEMGGLADLILVDWSQLRLVRLNDAPALRAYLAEQYQ